MSSDGPGDGLGTTHMASGGSYEPRLTGSSTGGIHAGPNHALASSGDRTGPASVLASGVDQPAQMITGIAGPSRTSRCVSRWLLGGSLPGSRNRCRPQQGTCRSLPRNGDGCGGRLCPGWPHPGGLNGRWNSPDLRSHAVTGRG